MKQQLIRFSTWLLRSPVSYLEQVILTFKDTIRVPLRDL